MMYIVYYLGAGNAIVFDKQFDSIAKAKAYISERKVHKHYMHFGILQAVEVA